MSENIFIFLLLFLPFQCVVNLTDSGLCVSLTFDGLITCQHPTSNASNHCRGSQPVGTIAKYMCKPHYILQSVDDLTLNSGNNNVLKCGQNGSWIGHGRFQSAFCQEDCGRRLTNPKPLIVNGKPTNSTAWPWHVTLYRRRDSEFDYICGGTIISRSTILTVAHCVTDVNQDRLFPNSTLVVLGAFTSNFTENRLQIDAQIVEVNKIYVSENFDVKKEYQADIAVLHLSNHIEYTDNISPICLPNDFAVDTNAIRPGTMGHVVGFGIDENGQIAHNLKHGVLEIKSHTECFLSLDRILSESQLCVGSPRDDVRVTVCNGDSGGGLTRPSLVDQKYYIHGLVSTGDPNPNKRVCESHAVFTRVYTFIFWIRDILKELKDNVLHLGSGNAFLHRQSGTEEHRGQFRPINQEWKNKVTAIELSYMDIDPEILLKSLDYSKSVQSINLTNVMFTRQIPQQRLFLPLLKSFSLNILRPDFDLTEEEERRFPIRISKEFLRSLLFFEKEVEDGNADIAMIPTLKTNVDITVHIFKLLKIDHDEGKIVLSQIPFANEILLNIPTDFRVKYLALSGIHVSSSLLPSSLLGNVETLILDQVTGIQAHELPKNFKTLTDLKEFVFILPKSDKQFSIPLNSLPKSLKHLALTRAVLSIDNTTVQIQSKFRVPTKNYNSPILFPDHTSNVNVLPIRQPNTQKYGNELNDLDTFYCDFCLPNDTLNSLHVLATIFPKLRRFVLKMDSNLNISLIDVLENFKNLKFALVSFSGSVNLFIKENGSWYVKSLKSSQELTHLEFVFNRKFNFWSSEADYMVGKRLTSFENLAFKSRNYRFNGGFKIRDFPVIPREIQERLHTIQIVNTGLSRKVLEETIKYAKDIKYLTCTNVTFFEIFIGKLVELPNLIEYRLVHDPIVTFKYLNYQNVVSILSGLLPNWIPFSQEKGVNVKKNLLSSKVNKYYIEHGECVMVSWDKINGSLTSTLSYTNQWLKHANTLSNPIKKLVFQYWELDPTLVPSTISHLNLNFVIVKNIGMIFRRLSSLVNLKLINVRVNDDGNFKDWDWIQIDLARVSKHSHTLEYLALEKAHVRNYSPGMTFEKMEFVYLESCTLEKSFVRNFMLIFPNVKRLVILGGNDPSIQIYVDVIILSGLRSKTLEWILMSNPVSGSSPNRPRKEINSILHRIGINQQDSKYLILERSPNPEGWSGNSNVSESMVESELLEMKGVTDIGIDPQCHAWSYRVETNTAERSDKLFTEFFHSYFLTTRLPNSQSYNLLKLL